MIRLFKAEIMRLLSRRATWGALIAGVVVLLAMGVMMIGAMMPPSEAEVEKGRQEYRSALADYEKNGAEWEQQCLESLPSNASQEDRNSCSNLRPAEENYVPRASTFVEMAPSAASVATSIGTLVALFAAGSFVGADFRHGTIGLWLTFVPQRDRVWVAKIMVAALAGLILGAILSVISILVLTLTAGILQGWNTLGAWDTVLTAVGRGVLLAAGFGALGASLAFWFRSTVAPAILPVINWFFDIAANILIAVPGLSRLSQWTPSTNMTAYTNNGTTIMVAKPGSLPQEMEWVELNITFAQGAIYLSTILVIVAFLSWWDFRHRDVS